jgi:FkbM family methyltransferase
VIATQIKQLAHRFGVEIGRYRPFAARRAQLLTAQRIQTVLDAGANRGQYAMELRAAGYRGQILSFEPVAEAYAELEARAAADPDWRTVNAAVGATAGEQWINVASNLAASSSLLKPRPALLTHAPWLTFSETAAVEVVTVDQAAAGTAGPLLLKMDVQGYEDRVLDGAAQMLERAAVIECELSLTELYEQQVRFATMIARLDAAGFALIDIDPVFWDQIGRVLSFDGLFVQQHS